MKPLLAHIYEPHRVTYPCYVQPKLNGIRALYQNGSFQSRDQLPFTKGLLDHLSIPLQQVFGPKVVLDGELYHHGWPLQRINAAVTPIRLKPTEDTALVEYHVFDVVDFGKSFRERHRRVIEDCVNYDGINLPVCTGVTWIGCGNPYNEQQADAMYAEYVSRGYEGMMYRLGDCPYTVPKQPCVKGTYSKSKFMSDKDNRVWHMLKRKDWQDDEFDFVSINETTGELGEPGFQIWCQAKNGKLFKFGSGLSRAEVQHYLNNPPIGQKIKGKYLCLSSEGLPLNGTILCINPK